MGELVRSIDWSGTDLGPIQSWPQSLHTAVSVCLNSSFPMFVWWGPNLINLYNDAYRHILGRDKHPRALGQRASETWSEIWDVIGLHASQVMNEGTPTWAEDQLLLMERSGYVEETYFTFSYGPIRAEGGEVGGVFCACTETTRRVLGERRLRTLSELSACIGEAKSPLDACAMAGEVLGRNPFDIPYAMIYLVDEKRQSADLVALTHVNVGPPIKEHIALDAPDDGCPLTQSLTHTKNVHLPELTPEIVARVGSPWPEPVRESLILQLRRPGEEQPYGILVAGISPRRELDADYRSFLALAAEHIAASIGNALAFEETRRRAEALAELDRSKTVFFTNVSHEFRTPLTLILGPLEDMLRLATPGTPEHTHLETAQRNALRLLRLVNTLLDFSRLEAGRVDAHFEPTDLAEITRDIASAFQSAIERAGLAFRTDFQSLPRPVHVDRDMWEKVVLNLLSNAFKFTFTGGIYLSIRPHQDFAELEVRDTGVGIPSSEQHKIFNRFQRIEQIRGRTHEGSGIGLAFVHELVRLHHGTVSFESAPGEGTTFTVRIPFSGPHTETPAPPERHRKEAAGLFLKDPLWTPEAKTTKPAALSALTGFFPGAGRILIADDNADMRQYMKTLLEPHFRVEVVANGAQALESIQRDPPGLVLTDIMMPEMDGLELLHQLRLDGRTRELPVILLSARAGEEARIGGLASGADDYLVKPFSARELLARVQTHYRMRQVRDASSRALQDMNTHLRRVIETITDCYIALDRDFRYVDLNERALEFLGRSRDELIGHTMWEVYPEITGTDREQNFRRAMERQEICTFDDSPLPHPGRTVEVTLCPHAAGMLIYFRDVTEIRSTEAARRLSERRYENLISVLPLALYTCDAQGRIDYFNSVAEQLWGRAPRLGDPDEVFCGSFKAFLPNGQAIAPDQTPMAIATRTGQSFRGEEVMIERPDGSRILCSVNIDPLRDENGKVVGALNVFEEITARRQAEEARRQSEERFHLLADNIAQLAWITDATGYIHWYNKRWFEYTGATMQEMQGWGWTRVHHQDHVDRVVKSFSESLATGEPWEDLFPLRRYDGEYRWFLSRAKPIHGEDGSIVSWFGSNTDVTDRLEAERKLAELNQTLEQRVEERTVEVNRLADQLRGLAAELTRVEQRERRRLATILHDHIQQLLVAAQMQVELAARNPNHPVGGRLERAAAIIKEAIAASRSLTVELSPPVLQEAGLLAALHWLAAQMAANHQFTVHVLQDNPLEPRNEELRFLLFLSVRELLFNALKHSSVQEATISLGQSEDGRTVLTVIDHGAGFDLARKQQDQNAATFGLFSIQERLAYAGGQMELKTAPGQGVRVTLIGPRESEPPQEHALIDLEERAPTAEFTERPQGGKVRVLLVDDHKILREGIAGLLRMDAGIEIIGEAANGREAVNFARKLHPDVIIMDVNMPEMNGVEATRVITNEMPRIRIVALSMHSEEDVAASMLAAGATAYVTKGGPARDLIDAVLSCVAR